MKLNKWTFAPVLIYLILFTAAAKAESLDTNFLHAINMVESSGKQGAIHGDHGAALGGFQIHKAFWQDAVEYDKSIGGKYNDVTNNAYAAKIVTAYLNRYAHKAIIAHDYKTLAYAFHRGKDNDIYWLRVRCVLDFR